MHRPIRRGRRPARSLGQRVKPHRAKPKTEAEEGPFSPPRKIAFEGPIGAGKSTFLAKIKALYGDTMHVHDEDTDEATLNLFYSNPQAYGTLLQFVMQERRISQWKEGTWRHLNEHKTICWDRSSRGDILFCTYNMMLGRIPPKEYATYTERFGGPFHPPMPTKYTEGVGDVVYFSDSPINCKARADRREKQRGTGRSPIPLGYFEGLDDLHFHQALHLAASKLARVHIFEWGTYDNVHDVIDRINVPPTEWPPVSFVAEDRAQELIDLITVPCDLTLYQKPSDLEGTPSSWHPDDTPSWCHEGARRSTPIAKALRASDQVVVAHLDAYQRPRPSDIVNNPFGVGFFTDAFKRRIMGHMARGHTIVLYGTVRP